MKKISKLATWLLIILNIFTPNINRLPTEVIQAAGAIDSQGISQDKVEVLGLRTEYSSTYKLANGNKKLEVSSQPVHYLANPSDGNSWVDIDNNLNQEVNSDGSIAVRPSSSSFNPVFTNNADNVLSMGVDSNKLTMSLLDISNSANNTSGFHREALTTTPASSGNKLTYASVADNTNLVYYVTPSGIKEDIIINRYSGNNSFKFSIKIPNTYCKKTPTGITFYENISNKALYILPKFYMWDSKNGNRNIENSISFDIQSNISGSGGNYTLTMIANNSWLSSPDRVYPVTIDPSINSNIQYGVDTYVQSGYPTYNMWVNRDLYVGRGTSKGVSRTFLPFFFDNLSGARILNANVNVYQFYCAGVCASSNVDVNLSGDYDPYSVTWNTQPPMLEHITSSFSNTSSGWMGFNVTDALKYWFNSSNPNGSRIGSFLFSSSDESSWGYRQWVAENNPDDWAQDKKPNLSVEYNDYNAGYAPGVFPANSRILGNITLPIDIYNTGRFSWRPGETFLSYHIYDRAGNAINWEGARTPLPNEISPGGSVRLNATINAFNTPGDYTIRWDMVHEGVTWFSSQGVPTRNQDISILDLPEYAAEYKTDPVPNMVSGGSTLVPVNITNRSNKTWIPAHYAIGYHWYNSSNQPVLTNNVSNPIDKDIAKYEGFGSVLANVQSPALPGNYILKIDLVEDSTVWFSSRGVSTYDIPVSVTPASLSSVNHTGREKYYAMAGPVDLSSGFYSFSKTDLSVSSNTGALSVVRTYSSNNMDVPGGDNGNNYIYRWAINGPYKVEDSVQRFNNSQIPNESSVLPSVGTLSSGYPWIKSPGKYLDPDIIDIKKLLKDSSISNSDISNSVVYAHTYVYSNKAQSLLLKLGSDEGAKVWLNGTNIMSVNSSGVMAVDNKIVNANLIKGWNRLLVKLTQSASDWNFSARFTKLDSSLVDGLNYIENYPTAFEANKLLGRGWSISFNERLLLNDAYTIYYRDSIGTVNSFSKNSDGSYLTPAGSEQKLTKNSDATFKLEHKNGSTLNFDSVGKIISSKDLSGNILLYSYDTLGHCITITDGSRYITFKYNGEQLLSASNQLGDTVSYTMETSAADPGKRLSAVTDLNGNREKYKYETFGPPLPPIPGIVSTSNIGLITGADEANYANLVSVINKRGYETKISYFEKKVSRITNPLGNITAFTYSGKSTSITDPNGNVSKADFSTNNILQAFYNANGYKEIFQYDQNFNISTITPGVSANSEYFFKWAYNYDQNQNPLSETDPINRTMSYQYLNNKVSQVTDPSKDISKYNYSADGRRLLASYVDPKGNTSKYSYDAKGRTIQTIDPNNKTTKYSYSSDGDTTSYITPKSEVNNYTYNQTGQVITSSSAAGSTNNFQYDKTGRVKNITDASSFSVKYNYDQNGNIIAETDPAGYIKRYEYDAMDRMVKSTDESGSSVKYSYDNVGNLSQFTNSKGNITKYAYNKISQLLKQTDPSGNITSYEYDVNNKLSKIIKPNGNVISCSHNAAGDVTSVLNPEGTTNLEYDSDGNMSKMVTSGSGESSVLKYDANNNLSSVESSLSGKTAYSYDAAMNLNSTAVSTANISYYYDANSRTNQISTALSGSAVVLNNKIVRDKDGRITGIVKSNGDTVSITYDKSGRITQLKNADRLGIVQQIFNYKLDSRSNIISISDQAGKILSTYVYDSKSQLIKDNTTTYTYDSAGNRLSMTVSGVTTTFGYDTKDSNKLISTTNSSLGQYIYQYDSNGNITKEISSKKGTTQYFYDSDDYFVKAILPNGTTVQYEYDKLAKHRTKRTETSPSGVSSIIKFVYDGDKLISETDDSGKLAKSYTWDENEKLISITLPDNLGTLKTFYYLKNAKEDIVALTDSNGAIVANYSYDAFGNITSSKTLASSSIANLSSINSRQYSSYWYDASLGQYFMKSRMYNPLIGRFLSPDSETLNANAVTSNPYIYCGNNPVVRIDPSGKLLVFIYAFALMAATVAQMIINTPVIVHWLNQDADTVANNNSSTLDKGLAVTDIVLMGTTGGAVGNVAKDAKVAAAASKAARVASNASRGKAAEKIAQEALGFSKNYDKIRTTGTSYRIFDGIDKKGQIYYEAKNVRQLSYTKQLRDMITLSKESGYDFHLVVGKDTVLSAPLSAELDRIGGMVTRLDFP